MTKKELLGFLDDYPDEIEIVLVKDAEGNSVSPLDEAAHQYYCSENKWSGELSEFPEPGFDKAVISLWPVN
ncbi:hypothetical protein Lepto7375DRAFT_0601 [Leptolyngbya sp. PCC 7375]|nr:hypothetical protein Lepto7375DRAFT_0601 [Leptolyngbya sp. PCC 7375]